MPEISSNSSPKYTVGPIKDTTEKPCLRDRVKQDGSLKKLAKIQENGMGERDISVCRGWHH